MPSDPDTGYMRAISAAGELNSDPFGLSWEPKALLANYSLGTGARLFLRSPAQPSADVV
jgi:hypothetical protein